MRYLLLPFLLFVANQTYSQQPGIKLGVQFTQDNISGNGFISAEPEYFLNRIDRDKSNFSVGLTAQFLTNSNFSFESGLAYAQKDFSTVYSCPNCFYLHMLSSFYIIAPQPEDVKNRYISIPFLVRYDLKEKALSPIFEAGINNNFLINDGDFDQTKSAYMEGVLGLGISYKINRTLNAELKYNYRRALTSVFSTTEIPYSTDQDPNRQKTQSFQFAINYLLKH